MPLRKLANGVGVVAIAVGSIRGANWAHGLCISTGCSTLHFFPCQSYTDRCSSSFKRTPCSVLKGVTLVRAMRPSGDVLEGVGSRAVRNQTILAVFHLPFDGRSEWRFLDVEAITCNPD